MKYVLLAIVLYLAYQFIFKLVIPVYRTSSRIKKGFREMNERMQQQSGNNSQTTQEPQAKPKTKPNPSDYIEFEEIK